jgi:hypothetical protein
MSSVDSTTPLFVPSSTSTSFDRLVAQSEKDSQTEAPASTRQIFFIIIIIKADASS